MTLLAGFLALFAALTFVQVIASDRYRDDPRNVRVALSESGRERGVIVTSDGEILAESVPDPADPQAFQRVYPQGPAFAPVVGYTSQVVGSEGLEAGFGDELRSRRDLTLSDLLAGIFGRDLRPRSIQVALNAELQKTAYDALGDQRGAVVVLDPRTGDVLAYVSKPSYDPMTLLGNGAVGARQQLLDDPAGPLRDRAGAELARPGSSFKAVVAAAAFDNGLYTSDTLFDDPTAFELPGSTATISNAGGGPCGNGNEVPLRTAFVRSCNTVFADLAIQLGAEAIGDTAEAMGFNEPVPMPWRTVASLFPEPELDGDPAALGQSGIGERNVRATPLQMAQVAAAVANDGQLMQPRVVTKVFDADGNPTESFEPRAVGQAMAEASAGTLTELMERVVTEGTGRRAAVQGVRVAGKTGTAEGVVAAPDVWFIGFAPVEAPTLAIAVFVENGGDAGDEATGGSVAAPIASTVIDRWVRINP